MAKDILDLLDALVSSRPYAAAATSKRDGQYTPITWTQLRDQASRVARSLVAIGIEAGDRVTLMCNSRIEWVVTDLGIVAAGAITVPIYPSNTAEEGRYVVNDSGARLVFCEDRSQVAKILEVHDQLLAIEHIVQMTGEVDHDGVIGMDEFLKFGIPVSELRMSERRDALSPESILTIVYTAGTTGRPKGVMLTHANLLYEAWATMEMGLVRDDDVQLLILPLSHSFARALEMSWLASGHVLAFAENMNTIERDLIEVRPTLMAGVPRVFEKMHAAVVEHGTSGGGLQGKLFARAVELSAKRGRMELLGKQLGPIEAVTFALLRVLVLSKVHVGIVRSLGGRMRFMLSGGAPLGSEFAWFFRDAEIEILEGYGLTETSAGTTVNRPGENQIGTVGQAFPGTEIWIAEDGEVLVRGPGVMAGYWNDPEGTAEAMSEDGWFRTGDIGEMDPRTGALRITDRKKDLIITAGGKNIAPQKIENLIKADPLISHCVVHGDRRKYLTALVTLDEGALREFAERRRLVGSHAELALRPEVRAEVDAVIGRANGMLASYETVKKFAILPRDFSVETGELTPKLSLRRKVVNQRHAAIFDALYDD